MQYLIFNMQYFLHSSTANWNPLRSFRNTDAWIPPPEILGYSLCIRNASSSPGDPDAMASNSVNFRSNVCSPKRGYP